MHSRWSSNTAVSSSASAIRLGYGTTNSFHATQQNMLQAGFEPALSGISARRLLPFGLPQRTGFFSATGGIRTHTIRILRPAPPTDWATVANANIHSAEAAGVEPARPHKRPPGF